MNGYNGVGTWFFSSEYVVSNEFSWITAVVASHSGTATARRVTISVQLTNLAISTLDPIIVDFYPSV